MTTPNPDDVGSFEAGAASIDLLLVDDDTALLDLTETYLERELADVATTAVTDPTEVPDRLADREYDCLVSDFEMPQLTGLELLEAVRSAGHDVPFILFTGKGSEEIASRAISAGVDEYLQKGGSETYPVLAKKVETLVEKYRAESLVTKGFRAIESAEEGIGIVAADGTYEYVNGAYADVYGMERAGLVGVHWKTRYPDPEIERFHDEILPELETDGSWRGTATGIDRSGEPVPERLILTEMDDGGHVCILQERDPA